MAAPSPAYQATTRRGQRRYRSKTYLRSCRLAWLLWFALWVYFCLASEPVAQAAKGICVYLFIWLVCDLRLRRVGLIVSDGGLRVQRFATKRELNWGEVSEFRLCPYFQAQAVNICRHRRRPCLTAGLIFTNSKREGFIRTHRLVWDGGETGDVLGQLNAEIAAHASSGQGHSK